MPGIAFALAHARGRFDDLTVVLQDIDADALDLQRRLSQNILRSRGAADVRVEAHEDRLRALDGADFALTAFRPGGFAARHLDERIAIEHGIVGQETAGPGGFAMALRSVPVELNILEEVRRVAADDCLVLNYTNPVQTVSEAAARYAPDVPYLGLCDQTAGEERWLAGLLGVAPTSIELDTCGTNHMTFTRAVRAGGEDITDRLWELLSVTPLEAFPDTTTRRTVRLFRMLDRIPSEYMQYFFFHDEVLAEQRAAGRTRAEEVMALLPDVVASYRIQADLEDPDPSMARASEEHGDFAVSIMASAASGEAERFILNLPNRGQVDELPDGAVVETPAIVRERRAVPIPQGAMPREVVGLVRQVAEHCRVTAEAAVTGDRKLAVKAMALHPLVRDVGTAERLVQAYLSAHASNLPAFGSV
jgi:6-phospho-beta-glucosidase